MSVNNVNIIVEKCMLLALLLQFDCSVHQCCFASEASVDFGAELPFMATAFVQTGNELHYFSDVEYHESLASAAPVKSNDENGAVLNNQLQFTPSELNFGEQSMGVARQLEVRIYNPTASTVRFDAISGSTIHFHCSFPEHKTINPGDTTTFSVVFLPRQESLIRNVLFVHSSLGTFTYSVSGKGSASIYRVRPLVGAKVPINGTLVAPVQLHNPHPTVLHVTEMYTSSGDVHLELPSFAPNIQHPISLWEIGPYETKTVMNAKVLGAREWNASAYIKIKTDWKGNHWISEEQTSRDAIYANNHLEQFEEAIIVPFEVEITGKRGIYATIDMLDFGFLRNGDKSHQIMLEVVSTLDKGIEIETIYVERSEEPNGIYLEFASKPPILVKCGARQQPGAPKAIAKVFFDTKLLRIRNKRPGLIRFKGRIVVESRGGIYNITVPYVALVYDGSLRSRAEETAFHSLLEPPIFRSVSLTNELPFGVAVWNVTLDATAWRSFEARLLSNAVMIAPGESKPVISLRYQWKEVDGFKTFLTVQTNVTAFAIPLVIFSGKLKIRLYSLNQKEFNFGLMNAGDSRTIQFSMTNENPVAIVVKNLRRALPSITTLSLMGTESINRTDSSLSNHERDGRSEIWQEGDDFSLHGQSVAMFKYTLEAPLDRSTLSDNFTIETIYECISFPVIYYVDEGVVITVPEKLIHKDAFPGRISSHSLKVFSTFKEDMRVLRISSLSGSRQVFFEATEGSGTLIKGGELSDLGRVHFIPGADCADKCYVGMPLHTADGQWFTYGVKLPQNLAEIDSYLYSRLRRKFMALQTEGKNHVNVTITVDTDKVKQLEVPLTAELVWPRLLTRSTVHFPLTAVGNFTIVNLTLTNPSSLPVVVQLLPLVIYPDADALIDFFRDELHSPLTEPIEMNETLMFSLRDTELFTLKSDSPVPKLREQLESILSIPIPKFTLSMLLQPGMKVRVRVGFLPSDYVLRSSLLLIRNNLTVLEPVVLYGRGAHMDMQVEGRGARTRSPLMFEIQPHHLSDCHNPKRLTHKLFTTLTVKRSFTVVNTGEVVFTVVNISINNIACENRGFRILNCHPFRLKPNESHILDVAYTPDFLMSWNEAALQFYMHMNGTSWLFPIGASVPKHMLAKCHAALPRPPFESLMYYSCVSALVFCLICVVACAYLEGDRSVTCAIRQHYGQVRRVFDLSANDMRHSRNSTFPSLVEFKPSLARRHVLYYSEDSNILVRLFWQTANSVLWLFSIVWQFRGDETNVTMKRLKTRQARTLVKCHADPTYSVKAPSLVSGKSQSPPTSDCSSTTASVSDVTGKRQNNKNLLFCSSGHAPQNFMKNIRISGDCRSSKDKIAFKAKLMPTVLAEEAKTERTSPKNKEAKENSYAGLNRLESGRSACTRAAPFKSMTGSCCSTTCTRNAIVTSEAEDLTLRSTESSAQDLVSLNAVAVQTTPTIENNDSWFSIPYEKGVDERSEAGLSDTSITPEWANGPTITNDGNVDMEFSALADASERMFESEMEPRAQQFSPTARPPPVTIVRPIQTQQKKNLRKKQETSCRNDEGGALALDPIGSRRGKPNGARPSTFIEQLQRERKLAENQYLKNKMLRGEEDEVWPGFALKLPALPDNLWEQDCSSAEISESVWEQTPSFDDRSWLPAPTNGIIDQQSNSGNTQSCLVDAVRTFRLNPEAPPFFIENSRPSNFISEPAFPVQPSSQTMNYDRLHRLNNCNDTYIDDPLGLSGSLFGRGTRNIWASAPHSTSRNKGNISPDSAAVYWAEKFLADEEKVQK